MASRGVVGHLRQLRNINIERELVAKQGEFLIGRVTRHQVETSADVLLRRLSDEANGEAVSARGDSVRGRVGSTVQAAVLRASLIVRAQG